MRRINFHFGDGFAHGLEISNSVNRIKLLNALWRDLAAADRSKALPRELRIVAYIGEQLLVSTQGTDGADEIANLAIDWIARQAMAKDATQKVLLALSGEHQC